jgi:hypothetical protein
MASYKSFRQSNPESAGLEIFEITPIILGGDPVDPENKTLLTRQQHIEAVRYWNRIIWDLRRNA